MDTWSFGTRLGKNHAHARARAARLVLPHPGLTPVGPSLFLLDRVVRMRAQAAKLKIRLGSADAGTKPDPTRCGSG